MEQRRSGNLFVIPLNVLCLAKITARSW